MQGNGLWKRVKGLLAIILSVAMVLETPNLVTKATVDLSDGNGGTIRAYVVGWTDEHPMDPTIYLDENQKVYVCNYRETPTSCLFFPSYYDCINDKVEVAHSIVIIAKSADIETPTNMLFDASALSGESVTFLGFEYYGEKNGQSYYYPISQTVGLKSNDNNETTILAVEGAEGSDEVKAVEGTTIILQTTSEAEWYNLVGKKLKTSFIEGTEYQYQYVVSSEDYKDPDSDTIEIMAYRGTEKGEYILSDSRDTDYKGTIVPGSSAKILNFTTSTGGMTLYEYSNYSDSYATNISITANANSKSSGVQIPAPAIETEVNWIYSPSLSKERGPSYIPNTQKQVSVTGGKIVQAGETEYLEPKTELANVPVETIVKVKYTGDSQVVPSFARISDGAKTEVIGYTDEGNGVFSFAMPSFDINVEFVAAVTVNIPENVDAHLYDNYRELNAGTHVLPVDTKICFSMKSSYLSSDEDVWGWKLSGTTPTDGNVAWAVDDVSSPFGSRTHDYEYYSHTVLTLKSDYAVDGVITFEPLIAPKLLMSFNWNSTDEQISAYDALNTFFQTAETVEGKYYFILEKKTRDTAITAKFDSTSISVDKDINYKTLTSDQKWRLTEANMTEGRVYTFKPAHLVTITEDSKNVSFADGSITGTKLEGKSLYYAEGTTVYLSADEVENIKYRWTISTAQNSTKTTTNGYSFTMGNVDTTVKLEYRYKAELLDTTNLEYVSASVDPEDSDVHLDTDAAIYIGAGKSVSVQYKGTPETGKTFVSPVLSLDSVTVTGAGAKYTFTMPEDPVTINSKQVDLQDISLVNATIVSVDGNTSLRNQTSGQVATGATVRFKVDSGLSSYAQPSLFDKGNFYAWISDTEVSVVEGTTDTYDFVMPAKTVEVGVYDTYDMDTLKTLGNQFGVLADGSVKIVLTSESSAEKTVSFDGVSNTATNVRYMVTIPQGSATYFTIDVENTAEANGKYTYKFVSAYKVEMSSQYGMLGDGSKSILYYPADASVTLNTTSIPENKGLVKWKITDSVAAELTYSQLGLGNVEGLSETPLTITMPSKDIQIDIELGINHSVLVKNSKTTTGADFTTVTVPAGRTVTFTPDVVTGKKLYGFKVNDTTTYLLNQGTQTTFVTDQQTGFYSFIVDDSMAAADGSITVELLCSDIIDLKGVEKGWLLQDYNVFLESSDKNTHIDFVDGDANTNAFATMTAFASGGSFIGDSIREAIEAKSSVGWICVSVVDELISDGTVRRVTMARDVSLTLGTGMELLSNDYISSANGVYHVYPSKTLTIKATNGTDELKANRTDVEATAIDLTSINLTKVEGSDTNYTFEVPIYSLIISADATYKVTIPATCEFQDSQGSVTTKNYYKAGDTVRVAVKAENQLAGVQYRWNYTGAEVPTAGAATYVTFTMSEQAVEVTMDYLYKVHLESTGLSQENPKGLHFPNMGYTEAEMEKYFAAGETVIVVAADITDYAFDDPVGQKISGPAITMTRIETSNQYSFTMPGEGVLVSITYTPTLTLTLQGVEHEVLSGRETYFELTDVPTDGRTLIGWKIDGSDNMSAEVDEWSCKIQRATGNSYKFTITSSTEVEPIFAYEINFTDSASDTEYESGTLVKLYNNTTLGSGGYKFVDGETVVQRQEASSGISQGYDLVIEFPTVSTQSGEENVLWAFAGKDTSEEGNYIRFNRVYPKYEVTLLNARIVSSEATKFAAGETIQVAVDLPVDKRFEVWTITSVDGETLDIPISLVPNTTNVYEFAMPDQEIKVNATYEQLAHVQITGGYLDPEKTKTEGYYSAMVDYIIYVYVEDDDIFEYNYVVKSLQDGEYVKDTEEVLQPAATYYALTVSGKDIQIELTRKVYHKLEINQFSFDLEEEVREGIYEEGEKARVYLGEVPTESRYYRYTAWVLQDGEYVLCTKPLVCNPAGNELYIVIQDADMKVDITVVEAHQVTLGSGITIVDEQGEPLEGYLEEGMKLYVKCAIPEGYVRAGITFNELVEEDTYKDPVYMEIQNEDGKEYVTMPKASGRIDIQYAPGLWWDGEVFRVDEDGELFDSLDIVPGETAYFMVSEEAAGKELDLVAESLWEGKRELLEVTKTEKGWSIVLPDTPVYVKTVEAVTYILTVTGVDTPTTTKYRAGASVTIIAEDRPKQNFLYWMAKNMETSEDISKLLFEDAAIKEQTVVMPAYDVQIQAVYETEREAANYSVKAGSPVRLGKGIPYKFEAGKTWKVKGDSTSYAGGMTFYVATDAEYEFE